MLAIELLSITPPDDEGKFPLPPSGDFAHNPNRKRLRHYLVGLPADVQSAVDRLHLCGYVDRDVWSRSIVVPEGGIVIRPDPGDTLRYMERWYSLN